MTSPGPKSYRETLSFDVLTRYKCHLGSQERRTVRPKCIGLVCRVSESHLFISSLTVGEIRKGIELARQRNDIGQAESLEAWLQRVIEGFSGRILSVDAQVADSWGQMSAIRPVPVVDGLLAATAMVHDFTLVTRNVSDVEGLGVSVLDPFSAQ